MLSSSLNLNIKFNLLLKYRITIICVKIQFIFMHKIQDDQREIIEIIIQEVHMYVEETMKH